MKKLLLATVLLLACAFPSAYAELPDTGQTKCYNNSVEITCPTPGQAFYGQDAQYGANLHDYTDLSNGIVRDNVTGLEWQQATASGAYTWQEALDYCAGLSLGGHDDWRLPTIKELATLVDSSQYSPSINTTYFSDTVASYYWSSTTFTDSTSFAYYVYFNYGYVYNDGKLHNFYVRAVRGGPYGSFDNLVINNDGTVSDSNTGLMWQQDTAPGMYSLQQALDYCENLSLAGYSDWRLPNRNELQSLVDYSRYNPVIDTNFFPNTQASIYWSSTTFVYMVNLAWYVGFYNGYVTYGDQKPYSNYVRAVRGGLCGPLSDSDFDGICDDGDNSSIVGDNPCASGQTKDCDDNCINIANQDQADFDADGIGDVCDNCTDTDHDGYGNPGYQANACPLDNCPEDPAKSEPGICGCGTADTDTDLDGSANCHDNCPSKPNGPAAGTCIKITGGVLIGTGVVCHGIEDCNEAELCDMEQGDCNDNLIGDACECYADCNHDGKVILSDLVILKSEFGRTDCGVNPCQADANGDGKVVLSDLVIMKTQFGKTGWPIP